MSVSTISTSPAAGQYGAQAARAYKQQNSPKATTVQYTPNLQHANVHADLFAYTREFDENRDGAYSAEEIQAATGLDLNTALNGHPEDIVQLWDQNGDGKVDTPELATAILSIDGALHDPQRTPELNRPNGSITQAKREAIENTLKVAAFGLERHRKNLAKASQPAQFGPPLSLDQALAHTLSLDNLSGDAIAANPFLLAPPVTAGETFNNPLPLLQAADNGQIELSPGMRANLRRITDEGLVGQNVAQTFQRWDQELIRKHIQETYEGSRKYLREISQVARVHEKYAAAFAAQQ